MNTNALIERLMQTVPLFRGFSALDVQEFVGRTERLDAVAGQTLIREREQGQTLFIVIAGELEVLRELPGGGQTRIATLLPGDTFGEMALIDHRPRSASVRCLAPCRLLGFEEKNLLHLPHLALKLYRNLAGLMAERLRDSNAAVSLMLCDAGRAGAGREEPAAPARKGHGVIRNMGGR